jgi:hypothetical protein
MQTHISVEIKRLLDERQRHIDAANSIDRTLGQIAELLRSSSAHSGRPRSSAGASNGSPSADHDKSETNGAPVTLADHIEVVMKRASKPLAIDQVMAGVQASGYRSRSKDFRPVVSLVLFQNRRFKRVRRGVYTLR